MTRISWTPEQDAELKRKQRVIFTADELAEVRSANAEIEANYQLRHSNSPKHERAAYRRVSALVKILRSKSL
jgi:hypothetical protein